MDVLFNSEEDIEKFFVQRYGVVIASKSKINDSTLFYVLQRQPLNKKPNWLWYAFKFKSKKIGKPDYWRLFCMTEQHINGIHESREAFFKYYDADNKNKEVVSGFDGNEQNFLEWIKNKGCK